MRGEGRRHERNHGGHSGIELVPHCGIYGQESKKRWEVDALDVRPTAQLATGLFMRLSWSRCSGCAILFLLRTEQRTPKPATSFGPSEAGRRLNRHSIASPQA